METDYYATAPASKLLNPNIVPLTLTPEQVRKAAARCPDANAVLRELFPSVFEPPKPPYHRADKDQLILGKRCGGNLAGYGYFLYPKQDWKVITDNEGWPVLVSS